jgi:hypothetical protein
MDDQVDATSLMAVKWATEDLFRTCVLTSAALRCVTESSPKLSLNALVDGASAPANRVGADGRYIGVGDKVDVPGDMHGVVKSTGPFAGVQLSPKCASRRKNCSQVPSHCGLSSTQVGLASFCSSL